MGKLDGRVALITGASRGLGKAMAIAFAGEGAAVAVGYNSSAEGAADTVATIRGGGGEAESYQGDITVPETVEAIVATVLERFGKIDILVNNAGLVNASPLVDMAVETWDAMFAIHVRAMFLMSRAVVPLMKEAGWGRIVNIASVAGKEGNPNAPAYSAAKGGLIALTKSLGKELAGSGVLVNCVTPAAVETRIFDQMTQTHIDMMKSKIPMGRFGLPKEIAAMVAWLCSEDCSFSTGGVFDLSGGRATY